MVLSEDSRVVLFPVLFHRISEEDVMIYRIGGPTITTVATSTVGARAVRILSRGKTLGQVKKILSSELGIKTENLDLQPVVDAMVKARIVRRVDGRQVEAGGPRAAQVLGQAFQFAYQLATEWARSSAIRYLPPKLSHMALFWAARKRSPAMPSPLVLTNLERALGSTLPPQALEAIALRHASEQLSRNIDSHLLRNLPPATMVRWLRDSTVVSGMEPLLELRKQGRGAILCGFHFGAPQLLVPLLWRHGLSFTGAAAVPPFRGKAMPPKLVLDQNYLKGGVPGCGSVTWYSRFSFRGFLEMMKAVERGENVLLFPDGYFERPNREIARYFGHLAAEYTPSRIAVPFLGQSIQANSMVPWLWLQTKVPLFPVKLLRRKGASFDVVIEPALELEQTDTMQIAAVKLYSALERDIRLHPAPWNYWGRIHEFAATPPAKEIAGIRMTAGSGD